MLKPLSIERFERPVSEFAAGPAPQLQWIEVRSLAVDESYQREINKRGAANVRQIAEHFDWSKFAPVIVAPVEGGLYAIVDGQHRTTAALIRGIDRVPCQVVQADRAKQAEAFAAVNGNVTRTTRSQLHHAQVTAGDAKALEVKKVCEAAGVTIPRRNLSRAVAKVGQTQAVAVLFRCLDTYGRNTLISALQCVTQTGGGNPGHLTAVVIEGLCRVLYDDPKWREAGSGLLDAMDDFDFDEAWEDIQAGHRFVSSEGAITSFATKVRNHLKSKAQRAASKAAKGKTSKGEASKPAQQSMGAR